MESHARHQGHGPEDITLGVPVGTHHGTHLIISEVAFAAVAAQRVDAGLRPLEAPESSIINLVEMPLAIHFSSAALRSPRGDAVSVRLVACTTAA